MIILALLILAFIAVSVIMFGLVLAADDGRGPTPTPRGFQPTYPPYAPDGTFV